MTDFDYDVMQKKRTATGAFHRKGGSKSKKCSLPSDNLTEAQRRKLNGPAITVQLGVPLGWKDFKGLTDSLKKTYLMDLHNSYHPSGAMLAGMLGVSNRTVVNELHRLGIPVGKPGGGRDRKQKAMWDAFCNGVVGGGNSIIPEANEQIEAQDEQVESKPVQSGTQVWDLDSPDHVNACRSPGLDVSCYDPVAKAEERGTQYADYYDAARDAVDEMLKTPLPAAPAPAVKEIRTRMSALAVRYEGPTGEVSGEIAELMSLFNGTRIKVKLSVEVVE